MKVILDFLVKVVQKLFVSSKIALGLRTAGKIYYLATTGPHLPLWFLRDFVGDMPTTHGFYYTLDPGSIESAMAYIYEKLHG